jgi:hypothetical protein
MENLGAWLIWFGIPVAWGLFWLSSNSKYESPSHRRRRREWRRETDRRVRQEQSYIEVFRVEACRRFGGPCPHPSSLIDGDGKCHGCLTYNHRVQGQGRLFGLLAIVVTIVLLLTFVWGITLGPWSETPSPSCQFEDCWLRFENYPVFP